MHQWSGSAHSVHQCFRGLGRTSVGPQALDGCSSNSSSAHTVALAADVADATACASLVACAEAIAEAVAWLEATASASRFCKWRTRRHVRQVVCTTLQHSRRCVSSTTPRMQAGSGARHPRTLASAMDREPATAVAFMAAWAAARLLARAVDALTAVARDWATAAALPPSSATAQDSLVAVALALRRRRAPCRRGSRMNGARVSSSVRGSDPQAPCNSAAPLHSSHAGRQRGQAPTHPGVGDGQGAGDDGCVHGCLGGREAVGKGRGRVDRRGEGLADSCGVPSLLSHGPGLAGGGGVGAQAAASMVLCMGVGEDGVGQALSSPIWGSTQLIGG